jgi:catechol 2,3-dioxygenase-like lactoylglutathione lyase family enzyme
VVDWGGMRHGIRFSTVTIDSTDPRGLAGFYARLLGWEITTDEPGWVVIGGDDHVRIAFALDENYTPPVWPSTPGEPPIQLHLEIRVTDLEGAAAYALECGAVLAEFQPQDDVRVCLDPAGHAFCLYLDDPDA